jgi:hypothetical protein
MKQIDYIFLILIITFSVAEITIYDVSINVPLGWLLYIILSVALISIMRNTLVIVVMVVLAFVFRVISFVQPSFYFMYSTVNSALFFIVGLLVFSISAKERIFYKQLLFMICLCAPMMFLQMAGVSWVHYNTFYDANVLRNGFQATLFQPVVSDLDFAQYRPAGILYSGQPLGLLIAFSLAYFIFHTKELKWKYYLLFGFVVAISTSYYVFFSYIIIVGSFIFLGKKAYRSRKIKLLSGALCGILLFYLIFPGVAGIQWNQYDILNKAWVRLVDLQMAGIDIYNLPFVGAVESTLLENRSGELQNLYDLALSQDYRPYSIIGILSKNMFLGIVVLFILVYLVIKSVKALRRRRDPLLYSKLSTLFVLIAYMIINPQFNWSLITFLMAFPLSILFPNFIATSTTVKDVTQV